MQNERRGHNINGRFITERENFQRMLDGKKPYWVPTSFDMGAVVGMGLINEFGAPGIGGKDAYGVKWIATESAGGAATPDPFDHMMACVTDWREVYHPLDLDALDWEGTAQRDLARIDRDSTVITYNMFEGFFQRFMAFEGFQNCLCDLIEEPEECRAFFEAMCDERIAMVERIKKHFNPDIIMFFDDVAHKNGLFMSPEVFREIIKPVYKRLYAAMLDLDIIPDHHVCGLCEDILPDLIDCGVRIWNSCEPCNDLVRMQQLYGDKLIFQGGFGAPPELAASNEPERVARKLTRKRVLELGPGGNYVFEGMVMGENAEVVNPAIMDEYNKLRFIAAQGDGTSKISNKTITFQERMQQ